MNSTEFFDDNFGQDVLETFSLDEGIVLIPGIYAYVDNQTGETVYVGQSKDVRSRDRQHKRIKKENQAADDYIQSHDCSLKILWATDDEAEYDPFKNYLETYYINKYDSRFKAAGLNKTRGNKSDLLKKIQEGGRFTAMFKRLVKDGEAYAAENFSQGLGSPTYKDHKTLEYNMILPELRSLQGKHFKKAFIDGLSIYIALEALQISCDHIDLVTNLDDLIDNKGIKKKFDREDSKEIIMADTDEDTIRAYKNISGYDLIIGNPPYEHGLHNNILMNVINNNPSADIIWLAPINTATGGKSVAKVQRTTEDKIESVRYLPDGFEGVMIPIAIYKYGSNGVGWNAFRNVDKSDMDLAIRAKVDKAAKCCTEAKLVSGIRNIIRTKGIDAQTLCDQLNSKYKLPATNSYILTASSLSMKQLVYGDKFAPTGEGGQGLPQDVYIAYNVVNIDDMRESLYKTTLLSVFSKNGRDIYTSPTEWPESIETCNFTDEELQYLRNYKK